MERVHFIFPDPDQFIQAELPAEVLSNLVFGRSFTLPEKMIINQSDHFVRKADITLKVTDGPANNQTRWEVPVEQQMLSGNRG